MLDPARPLPVEGRKRSSEHASRRVGADSGSDRAEEGKTERGTPTETACAQKARVHSLPSLSTLYVVHAGGGACGEAARSTNTPCANPKQFSNSKRCSKLIKERKENGATRTRPNRHAHPETAVPAGISLGTDTHTHACTHEIVSAPRKEGGRPACIGKTKEKEKTPSNVVAAQGGRGAGEVELESI